MKQTWMRFSALVLAVALLAPVSLLAQDEKDKEAKEKSEKTEKTEKPERKDVQQIIITHKGDKDQKVTIEINGDKITVNGKPLDEYKDKDGDLSVRLQKYKEMQGLAMTRIPRTSGNWNMNGDGNFRVFADDANHAMLGVTTEKTEGGVAVQDITKESAAEKAGLKEGDVITKIDDKKVGDPDELSAAIKSHKPGDKVTVAYLRDKKEQKVTVELTKWKGSDILKMGSGDNFKMDLDNMNFDKVMPRVQYTPGKPFGQYYGLLGGGPKLGLSVQDTDDGKGAKVIEVDEESNAAKAGVKKDDVITEADGKAVNGTDDMVKVIRDSKDKPSITLKLQRGGKTESIEVKMPHKIKTADL